MPYDPSQPRDPAGSKTGGQWSKGFWNRSYPDQSRASKKDEELRRFFQARIESNRANDSERQGQIDSICQKIGYKGEVEYSRAPQMDKAGRMILGEHHRDTGKITIYAAAFSQEDQTLGAIVTHEITHARIKQNAALVDSWIDQVFNQYEKSYTIFRVKDGVTPYSRLWWDRPSLSKQAIEETICEVARLDYDGKAGDVDPFWLDIYRQLKGQP